MKKILRNMLAVTSVLVVCICSLSNLTYAAGVTRNGNQTSWGKTMHTEILNYECIKTYANGSTRKDPFKHYLKRSDSYYGIPGLYSTNVGGVNCDQMTPQGICHMNEYTIISAYCGEHKHNPVLYALKDGKLAATLVLPYGTKMHVGGIAFDGTYLWIANGQTNYGQSDRYGQSSRRIYYIKKDYVYAAIDACVSNKAYSYTFPSYNSSQYCEFLYDPAFCTFFEGKLWCGKFNSDGTDMMYEYEIDYSNPSRPKLKNVGDMQVPRATQGVAFYRYKGEVYLTTSNSWCRDVSKKNARHEMIIYKPTDYDTENNKGGTNRDFHKGNRISSIIIPKMSEEISMRGSSMFIIFESMALQYQNMGINWESMTDKYFELDFYKICVE